MSTDTSKTIDSEVIFARLYGVNFYTLNLYRFFDGRNDVLPYR